MNEITMKAPKEKYQAKQELDKAKRSRFMKQAVFGTVFIGLLTAVGSIP